MDDRSWIDDETIAAMELERTVRPGESNAVTAYRLFDEAAPSAAMQIIHLARASLNERVRFDASKYVTERVLGRVGEAKVADGEKSLFDTVFEAVTRDATEEEEKAIRKAQGRYNS